jgi:O-antigen/teichoic acid export membrane protein
MSAIENKDSVTIGKFYGQVFAAYSSVLFIAAAGIILVVKPFTCILVAPEFFDARFYTPVLVIAVVFQCFCQFLSSVYNLEKRSLNSLFTALAAAAANIFLNFLLIPDYGCLGAALATVGAYSACYVIRVFDARGYLPFNVAHGKIIINLIVVGYMACIAILEPALTYVQLSVLFVLILLFNFDAVLSTVKKVLKR